MSASENKGKSLLENAYQLSSPEDNVAYYREFSTSYDEDFVEGLGFALPRLVVERFLSLKAGDDTPIADLGCGTGAVGQTLKNLAGPIDGMDISPDMLEAAANKNTYRDLHKVDLTKNVDGHEGNYGAVLSSGTFTHGHLGPDAIDMALNLGAKGCLFVFSINQAHYHSHGFAAKFDELLGARVISDFSMTEVDIYSKPDHDHSGDRALIVDFRKST